MWNIQCSWSLETRDVSMSPWRRVVTCSPQHLYACLWTRQWDVLRGPTQRLKRPKKPMRDDSSGFWYLLSRTSFTRPTQPAFGEETISSAPERKRWTSSIFICLLKKKALAQVDHAGQFHRRKNQVCLESNTELLHVYIEICYLNQIKNFQIVQSFSTTFKVLCWLSNPHISTFLTRCRHFSWRGKQRTCN